MAAYFGNEHKDVFRAIDTLVSQEVSIGRNFALVDYRDAKGKICRAFNMTRDGFTLLAMGFTVAKALRFKLAYIAEFNAMEEELAVRGPKKIIGDAASVLLMGGRACDNCMIVKFTVGQ